MAGSSISLLATKILRMTRRT